MHMLNSPSVLKFTCLIILSVNKDKQKYCLKRWMLPKNNTQDKIKFLLDPECNLHDSRADADYSKNALKCHSL